MEHGKLSIQKIDVLLNLHGALEMGYTEYYEDNGGEVFVFSGFVGIIGAV
jgi:hypothetical protein